MVSERGVGSLPLSVRFFLPFPVLPFQRSFPDSLARPRTRGPPNFLSPARLSANSGPRGGEVERWRAPTAEKERLYEPVFLTSKWPFQDVAAFSEDSFDVKEWINRTFKSAEAQENKDVSRPGHRLRFRRSPSPLLRRIRVATPVGRRTGGFPTRPRRCSAMPIRSSRRRSFLSHHCEDFQPRSGGTMFLWVRVSRAENLRRNVTDGQ